MAALIAIVDTGPLYAAADLDDAAHQVAIDVLSLEGLHLVIPTLVVAEATYFVGTRIGPAAEARFLAGMTDLDVEAPVSTDWQRIAELVEEYAGFPLGGTDASMVALAERLRISTVITFDRRHFAAVRPRHCDALTLLPHSSV